ncbi:MAG: DUF4188 domain-containing protein [Phenylobacterium sp.]|uniref:DUF4188 domain-containing protein n=1 Tax=Phenylobacterium sp. TaxID=1871053 RepID=UPI001A38834C|nr:DUF4188 domain-containing protein [Phenylobacterium sp.]MBL8771837.1 DUF4188 domain-containing protein [Phenylobacterium sp.]
MGGINKARMCAELEGEFVVFLIGARILRPWKIWKWRPVAAAMRRMRSELEARPELGLLHAQDFNGFPDVMTVQYWRSFEHLEAYARAENHEHLPAWRSFYRTVGMDGDVGIWHETYLVAPGRYEAIYGGMPTFGLGAAGRLVDAVGAKQEARQRLKAAA